MTQTSEQRRADCAYQLVEKVRGESWKDDYGRFAHKLPILVRTCGPVAALEFLRTRGNKDGARVLLDHLARQFLAAGLLAPDAGHADGFLQRMRKAPMADYLRLTRELLAVLNWHKRLSVSLLDVHPGDEDPRR